MYRGTVLRSGMCSSQTCLVLSIKPHNSRRLAGVYHNPCPKKVTVTDCIDHRTF